MIILNGVPKSGTTLLASYFMAAGVELEPGGLMDYASHRTLIMQGGKPWGEVRSLKAIMADYSPNRFVTGHFRDRNDFPGHKVVYIYRHPRNILVSRARWMAVRHRWQDAGGEPPIGKVRLGLGAHDVSTVLANLREFAGWLQKADVIVRFEEFNKAPAFWAEMFEKLLQVKRAPVEKFMGDNAPWMTADYRGTWSGHHSDWQQFWDATLDTMWRDADGPQVERLYGYADPID